MNLTIERCELQRQTALNGMALLSNPLVADALPETTRARLKTVYASLEETYTNRLTSLARIATADPAQFCTETYATIQACRQAIANDTEALRKKIFPLYRCGQLVPGQFVDGTTGPAEEAAHANDPPEKKIPWLLSTTPYSTIISFYQNRLSKEKTLLTKALPAP